MRALLSAAVLLPSVAAAQFPGPALSGDYHFVHLFARESTPGAGPRVARNAGGTITFDSSGSVRIRARIGENQAQSVETDIAGQWRWRAAANHFTLTSPAEPELTLQVRPGERGLLLGSTSDPGVHDLFLAVPAPSTPVDLRGPYGAAYFTLGDGAGPGIATAFLDLEPAGGARFTSRLIGHTARVDDVNRVEQGEAVLTPGARLAGSALFAGASDMLSGSMELFSSPEGDVLIGFSIAPGRRDLLAAVRKDPDAATFSFNGAFWLAELGAEGDFLYQPDRIRLTSAAGALRAAGDGSAYIAERVKTNGRLVDLSTVNTYRIWAGGDFLAPRLTPGLHNLTLGAASGILVGAQVGVDGELTLDHGIFIGVRSAPLAPAGVRIEAPSNAAAPAAPLTPLAPGGLYSLFGSNLAPATLAALAGPLPQTLAGVRVLIDGLAAPLFSVSPSQINVLAPEALSASTSLVQVDNNGALSNLVEIPVAATAPAAFSVSQSGAGPAIVTHADFSLVDAQNPARPGETVVIFAAGLGTSPSAGLSVLFNGVAGEVFFAGSVPGFQGLYQINVTVPDIRSAAPVNLAIATSTAFTDLADLVIRE